LTATLTVEGRGTAVDTNVAMTAQGEEVTPARDVPVGARVIKEISGAILADGLADGSAIFILKLSEGGISGTQVLVAGAQGAIQVQSGADRPGIIAHFNLKDLDIPVVQNKQLTIEMEMTGSDLGDFDGVITILFD